MKSKMKATNAVASGRKWSNSLSMPFVPLGDVLIAVKETTRADYAAYLRSQPALSAPPVDITSVLTLPMTHVSRHDADINTNKVRPPRSFEFLLLKHSDQLRL